MASATRGGFSAAYPKRESLHLLGSSATAVEPHTLRLGWIPVACWKLNAIRFGFDSTFLLPETAEEFSALARLRDQHPNAPLSVFGHADPVGDENYNKILAGRRAEAVYAVLTRDAGLWERLYFTSKPADAWGSRAIALMLRTLGYDPGATPGETHQAVVAFQRQTGRLNPDGFAGPKTREWLFLAYMDAICRDAAGQPFRISKQGFLAQGADPAGKGDYQGCGEFNPVLVFSRAEAQEFSKPNKIRQRDEENSPNRRVMVLLFRPGSKVAPSKWPCPRANEGSTDCRRRFWTDGDARRSNAPVRRTFEETRDTFACRFYHRLTVLSPCEHATPPAGRTEK